MIEPKKVLSERELEIAVAYAKGESYREIASNLHIAPTTVRTHIQSIYRKLDVSTKLQLRDTLAESDCLPLTHMEGYQHPNPTEPAQSDTGNAQGSSNPTRRLTGLVLAGAVLAVLTVAVLFIYIGREELDSELSVEARPPDRSIAVLPFKSSDDSIEGTTLAGGLTADVTTSLSRLSGLFVISRNATSLYRQNQVSISDFGHSLGVRYILTGSVRRSGNQVRISTELTDLSEGTEIWAERYDRESEDIFAVQDEISKQVVNHLGMKLSETEATSLEYIATRNLDARAAFLKGGSLINPPKRENLARAAQEFKKAIELDPEYAGGYAGLSFISSLAVMFGDPSQREKNHAASLNMARQSLDMDPNFAWSHFVLGFSLFNDGQFGPAIAAGKKAVEVEPSNSDAHALLALYRAFGGEPDAAMEDAKHALKLAPRYTGPYLNFLGYASFQAGRYDEAVKAYEENHIRRGPEIHISLAFWAASYGEVGLPDKGREIVDRILKEYPGISLEDWPTARPMTVPYKFPEDRDRLVTALKSLGFPERR